MLQSGLKRDKVLALGMLLLKRHPDISQSLLSELETEEPYDTDFNRIPEYFQVYSNLISIPIDQLRSPDWSRERSFHLKVFIASMIRIYRPFINTWRGDNVKPGFNLSLSKILNKYQPNISKLVQEVVVLEKAYEDFRKEVDYTEYYLTQKIKPQ